MVAVNRWFVEHPRSRGETYLEHQKVAAGYGWSLIVAGLACLVHAIFPSLCTDTGSQAVRRMYGRMTGRLDGPLQQPTPRVAGAALGPGLAIAAVGAAAAFAATPWSPVSPMLVALGLGVLVASSGRSAGLEAGGCFASKTLLRFGVVLMGARVDLALVGQLGWSSIGLTLGALAAALGLGVGVARLCGVKGPASFLTAASVAICGASAALTVAAIQPRDEGADRRTAQVVVLVTLIGSVAMLVYPWLAVQLHLNDVQTAVFLGGTLHELAQAAGAGEAVSPHVGVMAVTVKLMRVACLAPIGVALALWLQSRRGEGVSEAKVALVPAFLIGFVALATVRNLGLIPEQMVHVLSTLTTICLLAAMVGLGLRMSPAKLFAVDGRLALTVALQSVLLATLVLGALMLGVGR